MSQNKMPPDRYSQMIKHLTRKKIKNPFTPASAIQRPKKVLEIEAFQDFNVRNPKAGGGMLVQPGFGGTRQGYKGRKGSAEDAINRRTKLANDYNKIVEYALNNRKIKNFSEPVKVTINGKLTTISELPTVNEWADMNNVNRNILKTREGSIIPVKRAEVYKTIVDETIKLNNQTFTYSTPADIAMDIGFTKNKGRGTGVEDLLQKGNVTKLLSKDEIVSNYIQYLIDKDAPLKDFTNNSIFKHVNSRNADLIKVGKDKSLSIPSSGRTIQFNNINKIMKADHSELFAKLGRGGQIPFLSRSIQNKPDFGNLRLSEAFQTTESGDIFFNEAKAKNINLKRALANITAETDILQGKLKLDQRSLAISNAQDKMIEDLNKYIRKNPNVILNNSEFRKLAATRFEDGKFIIDNNPALINDRLNRYIKSGFFSTDHKVSKRTGKLNIEFPTNKQIVPTFINGPIRSMENYIANNISQYSDPIIKNNIDQIINVAKTNNFTVNVPKGYSNIFGTNRTNVGAIQDIATVSADGKILTSYDNQLKKFNFNIDKIPELSNVKNVDYTLIDKSRLEKTLETKLKTAETYKSLTEGQRVVPPKSRPGQGGFIATELIPGVTKTSRRIIGGAAGFVLPEVLFYQLDKRNRMSKGVSEEEAEAAALQSASLGALKDTAYMNNLKKVGESMGVDSKSFDAAYDMNVLLKNYEQNNLNFQDQYLNLLETGDEKRASDLEKNFNQYKKRTQNQYALLSNNISDNVMNTVGASPLIMEQGRKNITQEQFEKPFFDIQKVALEKLKREKIKASPIQKRQVDTTAGSIGEDFYQAFDQLTQGAKNLLQGRVIPFASKIGLPQYEPKTPRADLSDVLKNLSDRDLERFNLGRGYVQSAPVSDLDIQNLQFEQPGVFFSKGGIAGLSGGKKSGPAPISGPTPHGDEGLPAAFKRVKKQ
jgi:hypothetical protein